MAKPLTPEECFELLTHKSIHDRAEGARQLAEVGSPDHLERIVEIARNDKSPAVRLGMAGAAADILSRYRTGSSRRKITQGRRNELLSAFRALDPGVNPGLFAMIATLDVPRSLDRILIGLRDPRYDVRQGAAVGLLRYCTSANVAADGRVPIKVIGLLSENRIRPDVLAEVMRVCVACGWQQARRAIEAHLDRGDQVGSAAEECLARLEELAEPETLLGVWRCRGTDAGERNPRSRKTTWLVLDSAGGFRGTEGGPYEPLSWRLDDDGAMELGEGDDAKVLRLRVMWLADLGAEAGPVLQMGVQTWHSGQEEAVLALAADWVASTGSSPAQDRAAMVSALLPLLPENAAGQKAAARLELASGQGAAAQERLETVLGKRKKAPPELLFLLGCAQELAGDAKGAKKSFKAVLTNSGGKGEWSARAQEKLD